jgi:hypothetical protein
MAFDLGAGIARNGWVLLTGGRNAGVMESASQGAHQAGGLVIGLLPDADGQRLSDAVDVAIFTHMGNARNNLNVLSSNVVIACGMGAGTASEVALAIKNKKPVLLLHPGERAANFFQDLAPGQVTLVANADEALSVTRRLIDPNSV